MHNALHIKVDARIAKEIWLFLRHLLQIIDEAIISIGRLRRVHKGDKPQKKAPVLKIHLHRLQTAMAWLGMARHSDAVHRTLQSYDIRAAFDVRHFSCHPEGLS